MVKTHQFCCGRRANSTSLFFTLNLYSHDKRSCVLTRPAMTSDALSSVAHLQQSVSFVQADKGTVGLLRVIHRELLPVHYSDNIYELIKEGERAKGQLLFLHGDVAVGEICYRFEKKGDQKQVYIMTVGVLKTYQKMGFGRRLIEYAIEDGKKQWPDVQRVFLHVHVENTAAMEFYEKLGFDKGDLEKGYYKSLDNGDAHIFIKTI